MRGHLINFLIIVAFLASVTAMMWFSGGRDD